MTHPFEVDRVYWPACDTKYDVAGWPEFSRFDCPECGTEIIVPRFFDRYLLWRLCGHGGMAGIYEGTEPEADRKVAVKIMTPDAAREIGEAHFLAEARLITRISHPGIVPVYDCGIFQGQPFLVMRFMPGGNLEAAQKQKRLPKEPAVICGWIAVVADGLRTMHREGFLHHDIKPANILLDEEGHAALSDFDLVSHAGGNASVNDENWVSPAYASPERLIYGDDGVKGDIFSLGVTAYELLTRQAPFNPKGEPEQLLEERRHPLFLPVRDMVPEIGSRLSALIGRMLAWEPAERPDYPEIVEAFRRESEGRGQSLKDRLGRFFQ